MSNRYRKRPVVIEAMQFDGTHDSALDVSAWIINCGGEVTVVADASSGIAALDIATLEGVMSATAGCWIIRGVQGEFYPVKDSIFVATYETYDPEGADDEA